MIPHSTLSLLKATCEKSHMKHEMACIYLDITGRPRTRLHATVTSCNRISLPWRHAVNDGDGCGLWAN